MGNIGQPKQKDTRELIKKRKKDWRQDLTAVIKKYEANTEWITSNLKVQTDAQKNAKIFAVTLQEEDLVMLWRCTHPSLDKTTGKKDDKAKEVQYNELFLSSGKPYNFTTNLSYYKLNLIIKIINL